MGETQHEPAVEIGKAQEASKLSECGWGWPVTDDLDLGQIHMYAMLINDVAQVMDPVHAEGAFFQVGIQLMFPQGVHNLLNMLQVFGPSLAVNENVIQTHNYKIIGEWSHDIVHHPHESGQRIFQTKGHERPFKNPFL